ncbi:prolyl-tRNA synthetase [Thermosporothrix hazakensis]|uniref:Proline--tRNA ligase n=1 Tax=Thermosporothrix hazakensis TaxID=644383 RepID=A0A326U8H3_THEHA|nr:proline--tRNA ligase [Thermosporothrix hazakensis]PZW27916.1 prolyl-tRNA synthetase [Thermosporothrix hazakensis]GCE51141.1 proline--tRNA ligase [Thermosporothrix hazakensis]
MRLSHLFTRTLREAPRDSEGRNYELLVRAGFIRQLAAGVYSFLPLGNRVLRKIADLLRSELERAGGQEVMLPILQPRELWEQPPLNGGLSRAEAYGAELFSLQDRKGRDLVLGATHEEVITLLASEFITSYRDLPQRPFQVHIRFRDQRRPRGGLLRTREFVMLDLYTFDADPESMDESYRVVREACQAALERCGLRFLLVDADSGAIGGKDSQEFFVPIEAGEDDALICDQCGYAANREKAEFVRDPVGTDEALEALEEVYTPGVKTIAELAEFLHVPEERTLKCVCYTAGGRSVIAVLRGDLELNEVKLTNVLTRAKLDVSDLHLATPEELARSGIVAGFTSPLDKDDSILIVADHSITQGRNFVAGANRIDYHVTHVNYPRDFRVAILDDIASAYDGASCARCGGSLHMVRGCEVGHIFKLGTRYSDVFHATFLAADGTSRPLLMGCYGIGVSRILAALVEQRSDEKGLVWPLRVAPYHVALVGFDMDKETTRTAAERLYADLQAEGVETLFDDRIESPGVKLNDADLIGVPLRVVVSKRSLKNGGVELKWRHEKEGKIIALDEAARTIRDLVQKRLHETES